MRKVFVSVGMNGRNESEVLADLKQAEEEIKKKFCNEEVEIVHNYFCKAPEGSGRLYYLGEAIKNMDGCDACYFVEGWENHAGCIAERFICNLYNIQMI